MARMPQVSARELVRFPKSQGFVDDRRPGAHLALRHKTRNVTVTVPLHIGADVGRGLAVRILEDAGFSVEDDLRLRQPLGARRGGNSSRAAGRPENPENSSAPSEIHAFSVQARDCPASHSLALVPTLAFAPFGQLLPPPRPFAAADSRAWIPKVPWTTLRYR
jgi:predicted RNA binding protein YcfA (HicA-like mRNA interferase family)